MSLQEIMSFNREQAVGVSQIQEALGKLIQAFIDAFL